MSRINDLIKKLCPNGVIYKKYGDVFEIKTGKGITTKEATDDGLYPIISGGTTPMGYYHSYNRDENIVTVSRVGANAGYVNFITEKFYLNDKCFSIIPKDEFVKCFIPKYIYYYTKNIENKIMELQSEGGVPTINTQKVSNLLMPMLPIDVQLEIINILDKFGGLEAELEAELEARKSQYEFWRGKLFENNSKIIRLGEFCSIKTGSKPKDILELGDYEYINAGTTNSGYTTITNAKGDCVTTPSRGQGGIGFVGFQENDFWCGPLCYQIRTLTDKLTNKYLYYYMLVHSDYILGLKHEGGVPAVNIKELQEMPICIPTLEEQERVVNILDKFDKLINDISEGLPAEIKLRRKQYEYYRNKILSFEVFNEVQCRRK